MFKKKEVITLKFKTFDPFVLKNLSPASNKLKHPQWWKDTPPFSGDGNISSNFESIKAPTIRRCPAINDYFSTGRKVAIVLLDGVGPSRTAGGSVL